MAGRAHRFRGIVAFAWSEATVFDTLKLFAMSQRSQVIKPSKSVLDSDIRLKIRAC